MTRCARCDHDDKFHTREIEAMSLEDDFSSDDACTECDCVYFSPAPSPDREKEEK